MDVIRLVFENVVRPIFVNAAGLVFEDDAGSLFVVVIGLVFEDVAGLAAEGAADRVKG